VELVRCSVPSPSRARTPSRGQLTPSLPRPRPRTPGSPPCMCMCRYAGLRCRVLLRLRPQAQNTSSPSWLLDSILPWRQPGVRALPCPNLCTLVPWPPPVSVQNASLRKKSEKFSGSALKNGQEDFTLIEMGAGKFTSKKNGDEVSVSPGLITPARRSSAWRAISRLSPAESSARGAAVPLPPPAWVSGHHLPRALLPR